MIYFIFVQYMKHLMQITRELSEYDLTTNSATNDFIIVVSSICKQYLLQCRNLINSQKVKASGASAVNIRLR